MPPAAEVVPLRRRAKCPVCGRPVEARFKPFCSKRCADRDLGNWLSGGYAIPGRPVDEADEAPPPDNGKDDDG